ncbi:MAG: hypothetical protein ACR2M1_04205 [Gemmatimonadaceae bacterium]
MCRSFLPHQNVQYWRRLCVGAVATAITLQGVQLQAQSTNLTVDTLRTSCGALEAAARQCAVDRLARRVRARLGISESLLWDASRSAFVSGDLTIPAHVLYVESAREVAAVATFEAPRGPELPTGLQRGAVALARASSMTTPAAWISPTPTDALAERQQSPAQQSAPEAERQREAIAERDAEAVRATAAVSDRSIKSLVAVTSRVEEPTGNMLVAAQRALARYVPPVTPAPKVSPAPSPTLIVRGPGPTVPVIIGREKPVALRFALVDSIALRPGIDELGEHDTPAGVNAAIRPIRITKGSCKTGWFSVLDVADTRVETDGTLTCYVRYGEAVTPDRVMKLSVTAEAGARQITQTLTVTPVSAPTYSVRGGDGCEVIADRVHKMLVDRGVPVVGFGAARRRADLTHCERFDRMLPVAKGALNPSGMYLTGEVSEAGVSVYSDAATVGPIELWTNKPAGDPTNELAEAIVARLLKYTGL